MISFDGGKIYSSFLNIMGGFCTGSEFWMVTWPYQQFWQQSPFLSWRAFAALKLALFVLHQSYLCIHLLLLLIYIYVYIAFVPNLSASSFSFTQRGWGKRAIFFESPDAFMPKILLSLSLNYDGKASYQSELRDSLSIEERWRERKRTFDSFLFWWETRQRGLKSRGFANHAFKRREGRICFVFDNNSKEKSCLPDAIKSTATDCITWERRGERWREENCPADELHHSRCFFTRPSTRFFVTQLFFKSGRCLSRVVKSSKDAREIGFSDVVQLECYSRRERDRQHK